MPRFCTGCGAAVKGHDGPTGLKCKYLIHDDSDGTKGQGPEGSVAVLNELLIQFGKLSATVEKLATEQTEMMRAIASMGSGPRNNGYDNNDSGPRNDHHSHSNSNGLGGSGFAGNNGDSNETVVALSSGARVAAKTIKAARAGEYVNLQEFIPSLEPSFAYETTIENHNLVSKPKKLKRALDSFYIWSQAWAGYESVLLDFDPNLHRQLSAYRLFIQEQDQTCKWHSVFAFDSRHRNHLSLSKSFEFSNITMPILASTCLANDSRKSDTSCYRCHSLAHFVKDCPFSEEPSVEKAQGTRRPFHPGQAKGRFENNRPDFYQRGDRSGGDYRSQRFNNNNRDWQRTPLHLQQCNRYNSGECGGDCGRKHSCSRCGGPEPRPRCLNCTPPPPVYNRFSNQSGSVGQTPPIHQRQNFSQ